MKINHKQVPQDNEYSTPPRLWRPLSRAVDGFDLDAATGEAHPKIAEHEYTKEDDGLSQPWFGDVWLNPPWSSNGEDGARNAKHRWLKKTRREVLRDEVRSVTCLFPSDTSSSWFHDHLVRAEALCFIGIGRIAFLGESRNPSFEMLVAIFGEVSTDMLSAMESLGSVFQGARIYEDGEQTRFGAP